jgi:hypothetical protein
MSFGIFNGYDDFGWINLNGKRSPIKWWKGRPNSNKFDVELVS